MSGRRSPDRVLCAGLATARAEAHNLAGGSGMQQGQVQMLGNGGVRAPLFLGRGQGMVFGGADLVQMFDSQAAGAGSLLAKVITGTLDEEQAEKYKAVMDGRRDCRWRAAVATVLGQLDETLGLSQKQHECLTGALLAAPPSADELAGEGSASSAPPIVLVATRLAAAVGGESELTAVLDPRRRAAVTAGLQQGGALDLDIIVD